MKQLFENITDTAYKTLDWILHNPDSQPADRFFDEPTIDGQIELLERDKLITIDNVGHLNITELGRAALLEHDKIVEQRKITEQRRQEELEVFKNISNSVKQQADAAMTQAGIAIETSKKADVKGWIAVIISGCVMLIQLIVNYREILNFIRKIL
mgnify:CR=1 FL=1